MKKTLTLFLLLFVTLGSAAMFAETLDVCDDCCQTDHCNGAACCRAGTLNNSVLTVTVSATTDDSPSQSFSQATSSVVAVLLTADLDRPPRA